MLAPFDRLYAEPAGAGPLPLPAPLQALYGDLAFPRPPGRPYVISNFVSTLDGVVTLGIPGKAGGGPISGHNPHDRALMGLLRAVADAVMVGAGTLRAVPRQLWTAEYVYPDLSDAFQALRAALGLTPTPLNVILSLSGQVDLTLPVFASGQVKTLIVTTPDGAGRLREQGVPSSVIVSGLAGAGGGSPGAAAINRAVAETLGQAAPLLLHEGGPLVMGDFFAERQVDELFLTIAPHVVGREAGPAAAERPGLVAGRLLAPDQPAWSALASAHRAGSHLFLRYRFTPDGQPAPEG